MEGRSRDDDRMVRKNAGSTRRGLQTGARRTEVHAVTTAVRESSEWHSRASGE